MSKVWEAGDWAELLCALGFATALGSLGLSCAYAIFAWARREFGGK